MLTSRSVEAGVKVAEQLKAEGVKVSVPCDFYERPTHARPGKAHAFYHWNERCSHAVFILT